MSCAAFVFVYYGTSTGILVFQDGRAEELVERLSAAVAAAGDLAHGVRGDLQAFAKEESIRSVLTRSGSGQEESDEALDRALLDLKLRAEAWRYCLSLRLISTGRMVVLDSRFDAEEGALLGEAEQQRLRDLLQEAPGFQFSPDGSAETAVRVVSAEGQEIGFLHAAFDPAFMAIYFQDDSIRVRVSGGVVFLAREGLLPEGEDLAALALTLRSDARAAEEARAASAAPTLENQRAGRATAGDRAFACEKPDFCPQLAALAGDYDAGKLPAVAVQLLILGALIFFALLLLLVLRVLHHGDTGTVSGRLELNDKLSRETRAVTEESAHVAERLSKQPEYAVIEQSDDGVDYAAVETVPTLQTILAHSQADPGIQKRERNEELTRAIEAVTETVDELEEPEEIEEREGESELSEYWQGIAATLGDRYAIHDALLLVDGGGGEFRAQFVQGFSAMDVASYVISRSEKLYQAFPAKNKVLFVKDAALENNTLKARLPGIDASSVDQMAIIPVTKGGEVAALLIITQAAGGRSLDQGVLHEVQRLSIL